MAVFGVLSLASAATVWAGASEPPAPFQSVVVHGQAVVATLSAQARFQVTEANSKPRVTRPGEVFTLAPGASLLLTERHSSFRVTAQLAPLPGLQVSTIIDTRSIGGSLSKARFFIPASE